VKKKKTETVKEKRGRGSKIWVKKKPGGKDPTTSEGPNKKECEETPSGGLTENNAKKVFPHGR